MFRLRYVILHVNFECIFYVYYMDTKIITFDPGLSKLTKPKIKSVVKKIPTKRVIVETNAWNFNDDQLELDKQFIYIQQLFQNKIIDKHPCKIIIQQIKKKINGYRAQDVLKHKLEVDKLVDVNTILYLLNECKNKCYYCVKNVNVLYENVREPRQWTLDRICNDIGHNKQNLLIACLSCNLHRKLMCTEKYVFTKQLNIIKQDVEII